jgi:hypothetical protein
MVQKSRRTKKKQHPKQVRSDLKDVTPGRPPVVFPHDQP